MSYTVQSIYNTWANSDELTHDMARRIYQRADKHDDVSLMSALARRKDLPADIEESIASRSELDVLLAWVRANSERPEVIVARVLKDKRATLMLELASQPELVPSVYEALAKSNSKKVAVALAQNESVADSIIQSISTLVVSAVNGEHRGTAHLATNILRTRPWIGQQLATETTSMLAMLIAATSSELDDESLVIVCKQISEKATFMNYNAGELVDKFLSKQLPDAGIEYLRPLAEVKSGGYSNYYLRRVAASVNNAIGRIGFDGAGLLNRLSAATADDIDEAYADAISAAAKEQVGAKAVADAIWSNPSASLKMLVSVSKEASEAAVGARLLLMEENEDFDTIIELMDGRYHRRIDVDRLKYPAKVVELAAARPGPKQHWLKYSKHWNEDPSVPFRFEIASILLSSGAYAKNAQKVVEETLTTLEQWEMFDGLVEDFTGSLPELLETVQALSKA